MINLENFGNAFKGLKMVAKSKESLLRGFEMVNQLNPVGRKPRCGDNALILFVQIFDDSGCVMRRPGGLHVYDVMDEEQPMC